MTDWSDFGWNDKESRAVIFADGDKGFVLFYIGGCIDYEITEGVSSRELEELGLEAPDGFSIWEGRYVCTRSGGYNGDDYEVEPRGTFRDLTEEEWAMVRAGKEPWNRDEWRTKEFLEEEAKEMALAKAMMDMPATVKGDHE